MSLKENAKAYNKNKGKVLVPVNRSRAGKAHGLTASRQWPPETMRPGPTPFVNKMKRVKWLPVSSELNEKLSENSQAAEDSFIDKGTHSAPLHLTESVSRRTSVSISS